MDALNQNSFTIQASGEDLSGLLQEGTEQTFDAVQFVTVDVGFNGKNGQPAEVIDILLTVENVVSGEFRFYGAADVEVDRVKVG